MKFFQKKPKVSKRTIVIAAILIGAVVISFLIRGRNAPEEIIEKKIKKQVNIQIIVKQNQVSTSLSVSGTVVPRQYSFIRSLTPGTLEYVTPAGSQISAGEQLFRIRDDNIENSYFNTLQNLQKTNVITAEKVSQAQLALSSAEARKQLAENSFDTVVQQTNQALVNGQNSAMINYNSAHNTLSQFLNFVSVGSLTNFKYKYDTVSTSDIEQQQTGKFIYLDALEAFVDVPAKAEKLNLDTSLSRMNDVLVKAKLLADTSVLILQTTLGGIDNLDSTKLTLNNYQTQINTHSSSILASQNDLRNTLINNQLSRNQAKNQLELAQIEFDNAQIGLTNAQNSADLERTITQNQVDNSSYHFNNLSLISPFSGTILATFAQAGQQVNVGQEILELGNLDIIEIKVEVDTEFGAGLKQGDTVEINELYNGTIAELEPVGSLSSGKIGIKVQTENRQGFLVAGEIAEVKFNLTFDQPGSIIIPINAATIEPANTYVFVVEDGQAAKRKVSLGRVFGNKVSVENGLNEGDQLILRNGVFISEGEDVEIVN